MSGAAEDFTLVIEQFLSKSRFYESRIEKLEKNIEYLEMKQHSHETNLNLEKELNYQRNEEFTSYKENINKLSDGIIVKFTNIINEISDINNDNIDKLSKKFLVPYIIGKEHCKFTDFEDFVTFTYKEIQRINVSKSQLLSDYEELKQMTSNLITTMTESNKVMEAKLKDFNSINIDLMKREYDEKMIFFEKTMGDIRIGNGRYHLEAMNAYKKLSCELDDFTSKSKNYNQELSKNTEAFNIMKFNYNKAIKKILEVNDELHILKKKFLELHVKYMQKDKASALSSKSDSKRNSKVNQIAASDIQPDSSDQFNVDFDKMCPPEEKDRNSKTGTRKDLSYILSDENSKHVKKKSIFSTDGFGQSEKSKFYSNNNKIAGSPALETDFYEDGDSEIHPSGYRDRLSKIPIRSRIIEGPKERSVRNSLDISEEKILKILRESLFNESTFKSKPFNNRQGYLDLSKDAFSMFKGAKPLLSESTLHNSREIDVSANYSYVLGTKKQLTDNNSTNMNRTISNNVRQSNILTINDRVKKNFYDLKKKGLSLI